MGAREQMPVERRGYVRYFCGRGEPGVIEVDAAAGVPLEREDVRRRRSVGRCGLNPVEARVESANFSA